VVLTRVAPDWCAEAGGLPEMIARSSRNLAAVARWVDANPHVEFLAEDPATVSSTRADIEALLPWVDWAFSETLWEFR
jgi:phosphoserine aminotransferase